MLGNDQIILNSLLVSTGVVSFVLSVMHVAVTFKIHIHRSFCKNKDHPFS